MSVTAIDHLVLLVSDLNDAIALWEGGMGMRLSHRAVLQDAGIEQAFFLLSNRTFVELIAPLGSESPLSAVLRERGEGVHVVALEVDDLNESISSMQARGVRLIGVGTPQVFVHPKSANGVLVQLWPKQRAHRWQSESSQSD